MVSSVQRKDAYGYQQSRKLEVAEASWTKDIKIARKAFQHAVDSGLLDENPFDRLKLGKEFNAERQHYVTMSDFDYV